MSLKRCADRQKRLFATTTTLARRGLLSAGWAFLSLHASDAPLCRPPAIVSDLSEITKDSFCFPGRTTLKLRYGNGIRAYLVSDPSVGPCSLSVAVGHGSFDEPGDHLGLAHLLEHVILEGSEQYPEAGDLVRFCTEAGGQRNGMTSGDRTVLGLQVQAAHFPEACSRLADLLRAPVLAPSVIESEKRVVHEEFERDADMDFWRQRHLIQQVGAEFSPFARFDIGNLESLAETNQAILRSWHRAHYTTDRMIVVVLGPQPLDVLQEEVTKTFGLLKEGTSKPSRLCRTSFSDSGRHQILHFPSTEGRRTLTMTWEVDCGHSQDLDHQSAQMVCSALNQGGPSSLIEELSTRGWITDLEAIVDRVAKQKAHVICTLELTAQGSAHYHEAMGLVYQTLATLKSLGLPKAVHQQMIQAPLLRYRFSPDDDPFETSMQVAYDLCDESLETYPRKTLSPLIHKPSYFVEVLEQLLPPFCVTTLSWPEDTGPYAYDQHESRMNLSWHAEALSAATIRTWENQPNNESLIPRVNPLAPDGLQATSAIDRSQWRWPALTTTYQNDRAHLFLLGDCYFGFPQAILELRLLSPVLNGSPRSAACAGCIRNLLERKLLPLRKLAAAAGLTLDIQEKPLYWVLTVQGPSMSTSEALCTLLRNLKTLSWTPEEWTSACVTFREEMVASQNQLPHKRASTALESVLIDPAPDPTAILDELDGVSDELASSWWLGTFDRAYWKLLAYGSFDQESISRLGQRLDGILQTQPWRQTSHFNPTVRPIPESSRRRIPSNRQGHGVAIALTRPLASLQERALLRILQPWFDSTFSMAMRSEHQVAYSASSFQRDYYGKLGAFVFEVLSHQVSGDRLIEMTDAYLQGLSNQLQVSLPPQAFENHRAAAIDLWSRAPASMAGVFEWCRRCAFDENGNFELAPQLLQAMKELSYDRALELLTLWLDPAHSKRVEVWTHPHSERLIGHAERGSDQELGVRKEEEAP